MRPWKMEGATGFIGLAALTLGLSFLPGGCLSPPPPGPPVSHVVLMWLKHPERGEDRAQLMRAAVALRMIPGVLRVETGRNVPLVGPQARRDFDLGVVVTFRDRGSLNRYERDPRHGALERYLRPLVRRYEVYDLSGR